MKIRYFQAKYLQERCLSATPGPQMTIHDWRAGQDALRIIGRYVRLDQRGWALAPLAGITPMGRILIPRCGCMLRGVLALPAGTVMSDSVAATSLIFCCSIMAWMRGACGSAFFRVKPSRIPVKKSGTFQATMTMSEVSLICPG